MKRLITHAGKLIVDRLVLENEERTISVMIYEKDSMSIAVTSDILVEEIIYKVSKEDHNSLLTRSDNVEEVIEKLKNRDPDAEIKRFVRDFKGETITMYAVIDEDADLNDTIKDVSEGFQRDVPADALHKYYEPLNGKIFVITECCDECRKDRELKDVEEHR